MNDPPTAGLDGETTMFFAGDACAEVWSPKPGTEVRALVNLGEKIKRLARQPPESHAIVEQEIREDALALWHRIADADARCE